MYEVDIDNLVKTQALDISYFVHIEIERDFTLVHMKHVYQVSKFDFQNLDESLRLWMRLKVFHDAFLEDNLKLSYYIIQVQS